MIWRNRRWVTVNISAYLIACPCKCKLKLISLNKKVRERTARKEITVDYIRIEIDLYIYIYIRKICIVFAFQFQLYIALFIQYYHQYCANRDFLISIWVSAVLFITFFKKPLLFSIIYNINHDYKYFFIYLLNTKYFNKPRKFEYIFN